MLAYNSIQLNSDNFGYGDNEDIYEAVEVDVDVGNPPSLPPMNSHTIPQGIVMLPGVKIIIIM